MTQAGYRPAAAYSKATKAIAIENWKMCVLTNILHEISGKVLLDMFYEREKTLTHDACIFSLRRKRETIVRTMPARSIRRYLR